MTGKKKMICFGYQKLIKNQKIDSFFKIMGGKSRIQTDHHINTNFYNDDKSFNYLNSEFQNKRLKVYTKLVLMRKKSIFFFLIIYYTTIMLSILVLIKILIKKI